MFREGEAWRPPAARTAADLFAESVEPAADLVAESGEPAAEPIEFVILADLVRPLVEITVQCDLMPVLLQKADLRRVFLNDPSRARRRSSADHGARTARRGAGSRSAGR